MHKVTPTGKEFDGFFELEITEDPYKGVRYYYTEVKMGEKENDDGTWTLSFDYHLTETPEAFTNGVEFEKFIGDILVNIIEEQVVKNEVIYKGGIDEKLD